MNSAAKAPLLMLIDGSSYFYRAFHALPPLVNSKGEPTGAIYGVANMIKKLLADYQPDYVAVVFDAKGKTFRDDLYEDYKANRDAMPSDLVRQIEPLHELIRTMGLPLLAVEHVEADDVIGTLTKEACTRNWRVIISTGDKDMAQLVCPEVTLINTMSNSVLDPLGVETKFGLPPIRMTDYFALVGDSSDNIPGVPGVGPKTAVKWLLEYETLDNLLENTDKITGKIGERLREHQAKVPLWRTLVTIKQDVELPIALEDLQKAEENFAELLALVKHLEFKSWAKALEQTQQASMPLTAPTDISHYQLVNNEKDFQNLLTKLYVTDLIGINVKSSAINNPWSPLTGLSIGLPNQTYFYLPLTHENEKNLPLEATLAALKPILENPNILKWGHELKKSKTALANYHVQLQGIAFDVLIEDYLLFTTQAKHDLAMLAARFLQKNKTTYEEIAGKGQKQIAFNQVPIEQAKNFACEELALSWDVQQTLWSDLENIPSLKSLYDQIELPLISTLSNIEHHGVLIDRSLLKKHSDELEVRLQELEQLIYSEAACTFNISSPKQLQEVLYEKMQLPILQKTATGQPSTGEEVLQELSFSYPLPKLILEHRMLSKLKSTYTDALPLQINSDTHRIHTSYNQAGTSTGRLSSSEPNLQNIPIRNEEGRRIRKAFIAPKDHLIAAADYSQIELRIMAHFSQDPKLLEAFSREHDIHRATAAEVLGIAPDAVSSEQRRQAKVINFGILYGMSAFGLAKELGVPRDAAQNYINLYFQRYPGVHAYLETTRQLAHQQGYVETLFGRRIYLPEINDRNFQRQKASERAAINGPLQGTAADIIKIAMNNLNEWTQRSDVHTRMIMQVHDELVFEVPKNELDNSISTIREYMVNAAKLSVPIVVDIGKGENWDEAH